MTRKTFTDLMKEYQQELNTETDPEKRKICLNCLNELKKKGGIKNEN